MNIVFIANTNNRFPYIDELTNNLVKSGNNITVIDLMNKLTIDTNNILKKFPFIIYYFCKLPRFGIKLSLLYTRFLLFINKKNIDIINIHSFSRIYTDIFKWTNHYNQKIIISMWGSDMYRTPNLDRSIQKRLMIKARFVTVATKQMKDDLLSIYGIDENKIRFVRFGIGKFDLINNMMATKKKLDIQKELSFPSDKLIVCCGYNGCEEQKHSIMIDAISALPQNYKEKLFLIFQMGYGALPDYIPSIRDKLEKSGLSYYIIDTYQTDMEVAALRIAVDIVINIQITDALSGSLQEHILAKNILLAGDWLPYTIYNEIGIFYLKTSLTNLNKSIADILQNIDSYKEKCEDNSGKMFALNSWNTTGKDWQKLYLEAKNNE